MNLAAGNISLGQSIELYQKSMAEYRKHEIKEWIVKIYNSGVISKQEY